MHLIRCDVPINELERFADAIIRRMDAKNLEEYLAIENQIKSLFFLLRSSPSAKRAEEKYGFYTTHWEVYEEYARDLFFDYYFVRDAADIEEMIKTIQFARYLISKHSN